MKERGGPGGDDLKGARKSAAIEAGKANAPGSEKGPLSGPVYRLVWGMARIFGPAGLILGATLMAAGLAAAQTAYDPSSYTYSLAVVVENTSTAPWTGPVPVAMNTNALITGGYLNTAGDDILFTDSFHQHAGGFLQDATSTATSTWFWFLDAPPGRSATVRAFMDGPEAQALFPLGGSDRIVVPDSNSLAIADDLTVEATVRLHAVPSATTTIVGKGSYELGVRNGDELFGKVHSCCVAATLRPNGSGDYEQALARIGCSSGSHWQCVDEIGSGDGNTTYVSYDEGSSDVYALSSPNIPAGSFINSVVVYHKSTRLGVIAVSASPVLRLGGVNATGTPVALTPGWSLYSQEMIDNRPGGGRWTPSDFEDLQVGAAFTSFERLTQVYVVVSYGALIAEVSHSPISAGQEYDLKLTRDAPNLGLYVNGAEVDTDSAPGTVGTSALPVTAGYGLVGAVGKVRIGHTSVISPSYALDLRLEGGDIQSTQEGNAGNGWEWRGTIHDHSTSSNDGGFHITTPDPAGLTATVGALQAQPEALPSLPAQPVAAVAPGPPMAVFVTPQPIVSSPFVDPIREMVHNSALPAHAFWMILSTLVAAVVSGRVLRSGLRSMLWAAVAGGLVYFVLAYILGIPLAFVALVGLGYFAAIGPVNFMR